MNITVWYVCAWVRQVCDGPIIEYRSDLWGMCDPYSVVVIGDRRGGGRHSTEDT